MKILALITFHNSIVFAYAFIGFVSLVAYLPQVISLFKSTGASRDVSIKTWIVWSIDSLVSLLYAIVVLQDLIASLIFLVDTLGGLLIVGLTARNRIHHDGFNFQEMRIALARSFRFK